LLCDCVPSVVAAHLSPGLVAVEELTFAGRA
jgi:hypothetical protein